LLIFLVILILCFSEGDSQCSSCLMLVVVAEPLWSSRYSAYGAVAVAAAGGAMFGAGGGALLLQQISLLGNSICC
jgi:hypothetical protein